MYIQAFLKYHNSANHASVVPINKITTNPTLTRHWLGMKLWDAFDSPNALNSGILGTMDIYNQTLMDDIS